MPIHGIRQPEYIPITDELRLRKYDGNYEFAYDWYQDRETCLLVNGVDTPMKRESIMVMYEYLNAHGELYFIEYRKNGTYLPIGDVTFWREDMPIVIGNPAYRKRGLGYLVVKKLTERARELGYDKIFVGEIYDYNVGSIKCFEKAGFLPYEKTEKGHRYCADLSKLKSACNLREFAEIKNLCQAEEDYKVNEIPAKTGEETEKGKMQ